jgi:hypothetical protein
MRREPDKKLFGRAAFRLQVDAEKSRAHFYAAPRKSKHLLGRNFAQERVWDSAAAQRDKTGARRWAT